MVNANSGDSRIRKFGGVKAGVTAKNGQEVHNRILLGLPARECAAMLEKLEFIVLATHTVLHEAEENIKFAYFPNEGLASVLNVMSDGKSVEVGLLGTDGFVGTRLVAGYKTSPSRVIMQIAGSAFRITAKELAEAMQECPQLMLGMHRFVQELALQSQQVAACNRLHEVEERLARWLLMCQDRVGGDVVELTQEFLAHMLATRRASVTVAAGILQKAGLITYSRGVVKIEDRKKLEEASCECYGMIVRQTKKWREEAR
jgi:CRP-like cAMP-binding protein